jgi:hypothetical protein
LASDIPVKGVELVRVDKNISEVIIGGKLRIRCGPAYSSTLEVLIEAPFETQQRHRVTATIEGFAPTVEHFETEYEAASSAAKFEDKGATAVVDKVDVQIDETGAVVSGPPALAPAAPAAHDDGDILPF